MTIIENADYFIRLLKLPGSVGGIVTPNDDGTFSMYLNADHSGDMLLDDYIHELLHIARDDFYTGKPISEIEHAEFAS